jgi:hypothetical protein
MEKGPSTQFQITKSEFAIAALQFLSTQHAKMKQLHVG